MIPGFEEEKFMFCYNCGEQVPESSTFCLSCGIRLREDTTAGGQYPQIPRPESTPIQAENPQTEPEYSAPPLEQKVSDVTSEEPVQRRSRVLIPVLIAVIVICAALLTVLLVRHFAGNSDEEDSANSGPVYTTTINGTTVVSDGAGTESPEIAAEASAAELAQQLGITTDYNQVEASATEYPSYISDRCYDHEYNINGDTLTLKTWYYGVLYFTYQYEYDALGSLVQVTTTNISGEVSSTTYENVYNDAGWLISRTGTNSDGENSSTAYEYDTAGNRVKMTTVGFSGDETEYTYEYDTDGNMTRSQQKGDNYTSAAEYDAAGNTVREEYQYSGGSNSTVYTYDDSGTLLSSREEDSYGYVTEYTYNPDGTLAAESYDYDGYSNGYTYTYVTDPNGHAREKTRTSQDGEQGESTYDAQWRLIGQTAGNRNVTYEYAEGGWMCTQTTVYDYEDWTSTYVYEYDQENYATQYTSVEDDGSYEVTVYGSDHRFLSGTGYDADGNVTET